MSTPREAGAAALFLLFSIGAERYALAATEIAEVLPCITLKPVLQAPAWVAGVFSYRGQMVPVLDLSHLAIGQPSAQRTSTRLVLVNYPGTRLLGLILEHASDTRRLPLAHFRPLGMATPEASYMGPVCETEQGLVQWVKVQALLDERVRELLYSPEGSDG
ncbi:MULTISPECIES: chemotaxis protein CheW [unclassified Pseudomonas]|uniref:chemotaxis protein CheW n=1 Tax=unclassified Pseudomonas TaxID=196821 RepID=UPI000BD70466|nr:MULTISPECIES: chemotaxis protein CheW [unclassified Pseudomonas]PVZ16050.1 chemotaxis-related protein WspB [Pseudomonas sp. URIL14HWK12:I12]PVZ26094.1 chemotaxis-related protein WspB [Pseudomonas sp. URIL14HWK12:I10]PVZ36382.1 chemotaxis-related protein WspB [Pseudomonas sp. URIL14HWK12:I11]SNZ18444.1 chemotaxis-related protein WspB [Pseudomonas sp. URIL14HWK12:I9]